MKQLRKNLATIAFLFLLLSFLPAGAQQLRTEIGEEKASAVDAMVQSAFPGFTPVWDINLSIRAADGTSTHLAITNVIKLPGTSQPEFVAGFQEYDGSGRDLDRLRKGEAISGVPQKLAAVTRNGNGAFQVVSTIVLEPNHALTIINRLSSDPLGSSRVLLSYKTIDLYQNQVVEVSWYSLMDANLHVIQIRPSGVEIKSTDSTAPLRVLYIKPSATGIVVTGPGEKTTNIVCSAICEPTIQQLASIN